MLLRICIAVIMMSLCMPAMSACRHIPEPQAGPEPTTIFGGCRYLSPIIRLGYSNQYSGYIGIGALIPFDQTFDWEGGLNEQGITVIATRYEDGEIYDLGYARRVGWAFMRGGWDAGLSYRNGEDDMAGAYVGVAFIGSATLRYLRGDDDSQVSIDFGLKF